MKRFRERFREWAEEFGLLLLLGVILCWMFLVDLIEDVYNDDVGGTNSGGPG